MIEALREPGVRAVLRAVSGGGLIVAGLMGLGIAEGEPLRLAGAGLVLVGGLINLVGGILAYRRFIPPPGS